MKPSSYKSINAKDEDLDEEGENAPVEGENLAKDMKYGYGEPPTAANVKAFNRSISPFKSVALSKSGSPCDLKASKKEKAPEWEEGDVSEEKPREEDGQYTPPGMKMVDKGGEEEDVKKSFFVSAELSKAIGPRPVVKPVPAPAGPVKGPDHYRVKGKPSSRQYYKFGPDDPGESDVYMRRNRLDDYSNPGGHTRTLRDPKEMEPVYKPLKAAPKKHGSKSSSTPKKKSTVNPLKGQATMWPMQGPVKKSFFVSAELSKAIGGGYAPAVAYGKSSAKKSSAKKSSTTAASPPPATGGSGSFQPKPLSISSGELKMDPKLSEPIEEKPKGIFDPTRGKGLLGGKKLKASMVPAKTKKFSEAQAKGPSKVTERSLRVPDEYELKKPGMRYIGSADGSPGSRLYTGGPEVAWQPEGTKRSVFKKSSTESRYGSQISRTYDIGKSCGMCGRLSKSCGGDDHQGCCEDCRKSMSTLSWHDSHLS